MTKFFGLSFLTFKTYKNVENVLGLGLVKISGNTMSTALKMRLAEQKVLT